MLPYTYLLYILFSRVSYIIEKEREKMKEGRGLEGMALGTAHRYKELKYLSK